MPVAKLVQCLAPLCLLAHAAVAKVAVSALLAPVAVVVVAALLAQVAVAQVAVAALLAQVAVVGPGWDCCQTALSLEKRWCPALGRSW